MTRTKTFFETLRLLWRQPVGVAMPLTAFVLVWIVPQMADMYAGIFYSLKGAVENSFNSIQLGLVGAWLGFVGWYWTRAALLPPALKDDRSAFKDAQFAPNDPETAPLRYAPRATLALSALICFYPLYLIRTERYEDSSRAYGSVLICVVLVALTFWLSAARRSVSYVWGPRVGAVLCSAICVYCLISLKDSEIESIGLSIFVGLILLGFLSILVFSFREAQFGWFTSEGLRPILSKFSVTSIIAAAPFGWVFALLLLLLNAAFIAIAVYNPAILEREMHAVIAAIAALAAATGFLVLMLAFARSICAAILRFAFWILRLVRLVKRSPNWGGNVAQGWIRFLGLALLLLWMSLPPNFSDYPIRAWHGPARGDGESVALPEGCRAGPAGVDKATENDKRIDGYGRPSLGFALCRFYAARASAFGPGKKMPVIIMATEGGASRAAAWTLSAMRFLDEQTNGEFNHQLFAISSVSGGSLGAVTYAQLLAKFPNSPKPGQPVSVDWTNDKVQGALIQLARGDLLAPAATGFFVTDALKLERLNGIPGFPASTDRGAALEKSFERYWANYLHIADGAERHGLLSLYSDHPGALPQLFLNGTNVENGQRLITSTVRFNASEDLFNNSVDLLGRMKTDIALSTAVTNSARFPFVSPSGSIHFIDDDGKEAHVQTIDGGYFENDGARTASDLARAITRIAARYGLPISPIVVLVTDDVAGDRGWWNDDPRWASIAPSCFTSTKREVCVNLKQSTGAPTKHRYPRAVAEGLVPFLGVYDTRESHEIDALSELRRNLCEESSQCTGGVGGGAMFNIVLPKLHKDPTEAAPMNWTLNPPTCNFLLKNAPYIPFNMNQANELRRKLGFAESAALEKNFPKESPDFKCTG